MREWRVPFTLSPLLLSPRSLTFLLRPLGADVPHPPTLLRPIVLWKFRLFSFEEPKFGIKEDRECADSSDGRQ